ncbi:ABC-type Fe3+-hydroxamate transport system substrate-binding protein [Lysinibacillus parviboronicapiens]|uniref:ABC-type Fe3+-hydroxamate transport system substrate-binding protein n=1 Tax=Lysinibacillus parviboronicapiens TaxID=436516 RepID=A0ABV2PII5_9BACI
MVGLAEIFGKQAEGEAWLKMFEEKVNEHKERLATVMDETKQFLSLAHSAKIFTYTVTVFIVVGKQFIKNCNCKHQNEFKRN